MSVLKRPPQVPLACAMLALLAISAAPAPADVPSRIAASRAREHALRAAIAADTRHAHGFQGRINELRSRLAQIENSLAIERSQLSAVQQHLRKQRRRLAGLRQQLVDDQQKLARQLVASYETPAPDIATVVLDAHGFSDLMNRLDDLKLISEHNAADTKQVAEQKHAVALETSRLAATEARQQRIADASLIQRTQVDSLRLAVVSQQERFVRARARKGGQLGRLRRRRASLVRQLSVAQARSAGVQSYAGSPGHSAGGARISPHGAFSPHGGSVGLFLAPGTNYSVGDEPQLAARLDTMARALGLHLIGLSGYRSPQHSVEVGGFANDPHTRGQASDSPGVEGVPEATLERYGLTRPFPGAAEADHIQLLGSRH